ncbi:Shwachman-Bodian-Diamond syndrome (SBDS) protein-like [Novymonas esmeraldas]|uniref:Shwachman-Bodian-Diamond syndrome (SBDS) protein-like n=1 Tax=Novymonas esmeraldas TaxID=1808958 RepID=A0AAW0F4Z3_9TRYP
MSARMQFPLSQRRHTNIAVVRYAKNGVKLEIACYKNKVISYRSGTENRMDEVLQVERIFANVARGYLASEKEIETVFGTDMTEQEAIKYMLDHGELQVAQQERTAEVDEMFKDIAVIISQKCINAKTQHPFPSQVIEQALRSIGAAVKLDQPVKKQALSLIHLLIDSDVIPIARANMKLRCTTTTEAALDKLRDWCRDSDAEVVDRDAVVGGSGSVLLLVQPNLFRDLDRFVKEELPTGSTLHMVDAAVTDVGDADVLLDANAVSRANAQPSRTEAAAAASSGAPRTAAAPSSSSATASDAKVSKRGGTEVSSSVGRDGATASGGGPPRGDKAGKSRAAVDGDIAAQLQRLGLDPAHDLHDDDNSDKDDEDSGAGRGGKGKKGNKKANKKKATGNTTTTAAAAAAANSDDDDDDDGRRGKKAKRTAKKGKKAAVAEAPVPEAEEVVDESDEELMVNRKQRAKKQQEMQTQHGGNKNDWDEEDFDYGDEEEVQEAH